MGWAKGRTTDAGEAVVEDAAAQVELELLGDEGRAVADGVAIHLSQERTEVFADDVVDQVEARRGLGAQPPEILQKE